MKKRKPVMFPFSETLVSPLAFCDLIEVQPLDGPAGVMFHLNDSTGMPFNCLTESDTAAARETLTKALQEMYGPDCGEAVPNGIRFGGQRGDYVFWVSFDGTLGIDSTNFCMRSDPTKRLPQVMLRSLETKNPQGLKDEITRFVNKWLPQLVPVRSKSDPYAPPREDYKCRLSSLNQCKRQMLTKREQMFKRSTRKSD